MDEVLDKLEEVFKKEKESAEGKSVYIPFLEAFTGSTNSQDWESILKTLSFDRYDSQWQSYFMRNPPLKNKSTMAPRQKIAFLSSALRDIQSFYFEGKYGTRYDDITCMLNAAHFSNNSLGRLKHIRKQLGDS